MIEEQEDKTTEEAPAEEAPAVEAEAAPEAEAPEAEAPAEEAPAEEAPAADEPAAEAEAPAADEPAAEAEAPAAQAPAEDAEPEEQLGPKERRRRARGQAGEAKPPRTLEERIAERAAERATLAKHRRARRGSEREERRAGGERTRPQPQPIDKATGAQRVRQGVVVSDKADKTITVKIDVARPHRVYKKIVRTSSTLHAHDETNEAHIGDTVRVIESRPLSKTKRWRLVEILERAR